ncbi:MAG TPA: sulfurtransferase [Terriglobales bacterium]|nr:sulfurtransferase [Terriglobales bacterium]
MKHLALISLLLVPMASFAGTKPAHPEMLVSTDWLANHLTEKNLVVVHIGPKVAEYDEGHIPGARFLPTEKIAAEKSSVKNELLATEQLVVNLEALGISNKSRVVIYTGPETATHATRLYWTLDYLGIAKKASLLDGGLAKWKSENRPLSKEATIVAKRGVIRPKLQPKLIAHLDDVTAASQNKSQAVLVDSRPENRYHEGHIPGAMPLFWGHTVASASRTDFLNLDDIRKAYESAGIKPGSKLITYCESGFQATHGYFTAKYLGYDVKMYDGSFQEWNDLKKQPVVTGDKPQ